jgi:hypothetical protein
MPRKRKKNKEKGTRKSAVYSEKSTCTALRAQSPTWSG